MEREEEGRKGWRKGGKGKVSNDGRERIFVDGRKERK